MRQQMKAVMGMDETQMEKVSKGQAPIPGDVYKRQVVATAVIMPKNCYIEGVTDSKKLSEKKRKLLRTKIEENALSIVTVFIDEKTIDRCV